MRHQDATDRLALVEALTIGGSSKNGNFGRLLSIRSSSIEARWVTLTLAASRAARRRRAIGSAAISATPISRMAAIAGAAAIGGILDDRGNGCATAIIIAVRARVDMGALIDAARCKRSEKQNWSEN
jgi:hypothetical protein